MALTIRWLGLSVGLLFVGLGGVAGCGGSSNGADDGSSGLDGAPPETGGSVGPASGGAHGGGGIIGVDGGGGGGGGNGGQGGTLALDGGGIDAPSGTGGSIPPACGQAGTPCCDGNSCGGGGCCVSNICMAENTQCVNLGEGICKAGSCGACGGARQPCCGANPAAGACTAPGTTCSKGTCAECGDPGSPCCASAGGAGTCSGTNAMCGSGGFCVTCGLLGSQCCANQACSGGCCVNGMCMASSACVGPADAASIDVNVQADVPMGAGGIPGTGGTITAGTGGAPGTGGVPGTGGTSTPWTAPAGCGNGVLAPPETCDDGNTFPFDGCSSDCRIEPDCSAGACKSRCGDGFVIGEECDDGNTLAGDGCSSQCTVEPGWICAQPPIGDTMKVPAVYRDFKSSGNTTGGNDFENGVTGSYTPTTGMVKASLDAKGKPVLSTTAPTAAHVASAASFATWYADVSGANHATASKLTLWNDGKGNYVNRWGADGEQWPVTTKAYWCGSSGSEARDDGGNVIPCSFQTDAGRSTTDCDEAVAAGQEILACTLNNGTYQGTVLVARVDGNPVFFPVDRDTFSPASELRFAQIPPYYDAGKTWPHDVDANGKDILHNFSFTSEIRYWFKYEAGQSYQLDVAGDDDVWVFVNGKLAIDLGGIHTPVDGSMVITNGNGTTTVTPFDYQGLPATPIKSTVSLGLQDGSVYEIAVFQAERQSTSSTFKLTLAGFNTAPSACHPN